MDRHLLMQKIALPYASRQGTPRLELSQRRLARPAMRSLIRATVGGPWRGVCRVAQIGPVMHAGALPPVAGNAWPVPAVRMGRCVRTPLAILACAAGDSPSRRSVPARVGVQPDVPTPPGPAAYRMQGLVAERVVISASLDPFLTLKALAAYSGISVRKLREYLEDPVRPLPHYRVGGKVLVRRSEFDAWIAHFRHVGREEVDRIVAGVFQDLG